jgi:hypothetical protein
VTDRKGFGLDPPATGVTLESLSGKPAQTIGLGDANPIGGTIYALLPGGKEVAVVSGTLGEVGKKGLQDVRDKSLLAFDPWKVNSLTLEHEHEAEHGHPREPEKVELRKPAEGWKLTAPIEAPGDGPTITDLLSAVERLRATRFVVEKGTPADEKQYGLDPPAARMTLAQDGKEGTQTLLFGRQDGAERYARVVGHDPIVAIPGDIFSKVASGLPELRRREALGVSQFRVQSLSVARQGGEALVLNRQKDGSWLATGLAKGPVKGETVDGLLHALGELKPTAFDDHPAAAATAALASRPALDLTLEEEPESEGAAPRRQHLVLGLPGKNGKMAMRDLAWPSVAEVAADGVAPFTRQLDVVVKEATTPAPPPTSATPPAGTPPAGTPPPGTPAPGANPTPAPPPS